MGEYARRNDGCDQTVAELLAAIAVVLAQEGQASEQRAASIEEFLVAQGIGHLPGTTMALQYFDVLMQRLTSIAGVLSSLSMQLDSDSAGLVDGGVAEVRRALATLTLSDLHSRLISAAGGEAAAQSVSAEPQIELWDESDKPV